MQVGNDKLTNDLALATYTATEFTHFFKTFIVLLLNQLLLQKYEMANHLQCAYY